MKNEIKFFLAKSEPSSYTIDDLQKDGVDWWNGVRNYQAIQVIRSWKVGDLVFFYRSVKDPAIVGLMRVISNPIFDEEDTRKISWKAQVEFVAKFDREITLNEIKSNPNFASFILVRNSRLSTMACTTEFTNFVLEQTGFKHELS
ncbi:MAG: EVE domain-containing protein [Patescibacteria group bacterium]